MSITSIEMKVTSKGQVTIPKPVRDRLGIRPGSEVAFEEQDGRFYLVRTENPEHWKDRIDRVRGVADAGLSTAQIMRMTRGEDWEEGVPPDVAG